jgi:hypothetical protein
MFFCTNIANTAVRSAEHQQQRIKQNDTLTVNNIAKKVFCAEIFSFAEI